MNEKKYKDITNIYYLRDIADAIKKLNEYTDKNILVCVEFNNIMLYSDIDNLESAFMKIVGMTKSEFDKEVEKQHQNYLLRRAYSERLLSNFNNYIYVKFNEKGYLLLLQNHNKLVGTIPSFEIKTITDFENKADARGYTKMQMWEFIQIFGKTMYNGSDSYFEMDFYLDTN